MFAWIIKNTYYINKTMLIQCKTFNNVVQLVIVLTFIVSRGTNLILVEHDIQFSAYLYQMNELISIDQALAGVYQ